MDAPTKDEGKGEQGSRWVKSVAQRERRPCDPRSASQSPIQHRTQRRKPARPPDLSSGARTPREQRPRDHVTAPTIRIHHARRARRRHRPRPRLGPAGCAVRGAKRHQVRLGFVAASRVRCQTAREAFQQEHLGVGSLGQALVRVGYQFLLRFDCGELKRTRPCLRHPIPPLITDLSTPLQGMSLSWNDPRAYDAMRKATIKYRTDVANSSADADCEVPCR